VDLRYTAAGGVRAAAIAPTNTGDFVNGAWTGAMTVMEAATNVYLRAADGSGHSGESNPFRVVSAVVPNFTAWPTTGVAPLGVYFTNLSSGATSYSWNFGDGNFSTIQNPFHTYTNGGVYTVSVTATGADATNTLVRTNYIVASNFTPQLARFGWSAVAPTQYLGAPFSVTITAQDTNGSLITNFASGVSLRGWASGGQATNRILGSLTHSYVEPGDYTLGYSFKPNADMTVTHARHYFGTKVSLWTEAGVLLAARAVSSVPGTWVETPLSTPVQLLANQRYVVGVYSGGNYDWYCRYDASASFTNGTIEGSWWMDGDAFPTFTDAVETRYLVDLRYTAAGGVSAVVVAPTNTGNFVNGAWSGAVTVLEAVTNMCLRAEDASGHSGDCSSFRVINGVIPVLTYHYSPQTGTMEISWAGTGGHLQGQTNSLGAGLTTNWYNCPGGSNRPVVITIDKANPAVMYRLVWP
jgi:PKD repeat protein